MTAYAVSPATIDQVLSIIELHGGWARFACATSVLYLIDLEALGRAMLTMSAQVSTHPGSEPEQFEVGSYRWQGCYVSLVEGYRALRAFLDACAGCPATMGSLYQALEGYAGLLATKIANGRDI